MAPAVVAGRLVLVWAATVGPGDLVSSRPGARVVPAFLTETASPSASRPPVTLEEITEDVEQTIDLSWLGSLITWALVLGVLLALCLAVVAVVRVGIRNRWLRPGRREEVDFEVLPEERAVQALVDDAAARLEAVDQGSVRNGIVRCWARLEDAVGDAGLPRARHETSAEFTVRVLHRLDLDPHAISDLARLYREARFSRHELTEDARTEARSALLQLEHDLAALRGRR